MVIHNTKLTLINNTYLFIYLTNSLFDLYRLLLQSNFLQCGINKDILFLNLNGTMLIETSGKIRAFNIYP